MSYKRRFDSRGNEIYYRDASGLEMWSGYDEQNRLIYFKNNKGYEVGYIYESSFPKGAFTSGKELERIRKGVEQKEFLSRPKINPFELLDIE